MLHCYWNCTFHTFVCPDPWLLSLLLHAHYIQWNKCIQHRSPVTLPIDSLCCWYLQDSCEPCRLIENYSPDQLRGTPSPLDIVSTIKDCNQNIGPMPPAPQIEKPICTLIRSNWYAYSGIQRSGTLRCESLLKRLVCDGTRRAEEHQSGTGTTETNPHN